MEIIQTLLANPEVQVGIIMTIGAAITLFAKPLFAKLKELAGKTETTADDKLVESIQDMLKEIVKKKTAKALAKVEAKKVKKASVKKKKKE